MPPCHGLEKPNGHPSAHAMALKWSFALAAGRAEAASLRQVGSAGEAVQTLEATMARRRAPRGFVVRHMWLKKRDRVVSARMSQGRSNVVDIDST